MRSYVGSEQACLCALADRAKNVGDAGHRRGFLTCLTASRRQAQLWSKRTSRSVAFIIISFLGRFCTGFIFWHSLLLLQ